MNLVVRFEAFASRVEEQRGEIQGHRSGFRSRGRGRVQEAAPSPKVEHPANPIGGSFETTSRGYGASGRPANMEAWLGSTYLKAVPGSGAGG
jgi:hypothetical protein